MFLNKIMILGAGVFQVPLIEKAKQLGFYTIVVSTEGDYPGFKISDKNYFLDTRNRERILQAAKEEKISAIVTDQTDIAVPTVAYVAQQLGLKGISLESALKFTDKYLMRSECKKSGIKVPDFYKVKNISEALTAAESLKYPFMIKPVDNQGSRGISRINNAKELKEKFPSALSNSKSGYVIMEEFIKGKEIVVEGLVADFKDYNLSIGDREYFDLPDLFIPRCTLFPSLISNKLKEKVLNISCRLINSLQPEFGITHSEYLIEENSEEIFLVETAIRGGGVFISSDLMPLTTGIQPDLYLLEIAAGLEKSVQLNSEHLNKSAGYICFTLPPGILKSIKGLEELYSLKGVHKAYLDNLFIGKRIEPIRDKSMRFGPIIIQGDNRRELDKIISEAEKILKIEVETSEGIKCITWQ